MKKEQPNVLHTAIYIRVSTDHQAKKGDSVDEQLDTCREYVEKHDNLVLYDTYVDDGVSGQKIKRGDFSRLMNDVRSGQIDLIIFTKLDRWFRSLRHYLNTQATLEANHCAWLAVDQPYFDTSTPHGRAFVAQSMTFAELEAANDSTRIRDVFDFKYKRGEVLSGKAPLGYSIVDKHLVPNKDAEKVIKIFEHYAATSSLSDTVQFMEQELGIVMYSANLKNTILKQKKYIGVFRDNEHFCEPLISRELFDSVQRQLSMNIHSNRKYEYIFTGLIRCADCDHAINGFPQRGGKRKDGSYRIFPAYRCRIAYPYKRCPNRKLFYEAPLERYLVEHLHELLEIEISKYEQKNAKVIDYESKRAAIEKKIERLKDLYINEIITMDELKVSKAKYQEELSQLPAEAAAIEKRDLSALRNMLKMDLPSIYFTLDPQERRRLWRSCIREIRVDHDKNIDIVFL